MGIAVVCLIVALVCAVGVLVYLQLNTTEPEPVPQLIERQPTEVLPQPRGIIVTQENVEEALEIMESFSPEDAHFTASMSTQWDFPSGDMTSSNAFVANSTHNHRTMYFDVVLDATDEIIFSSPFIPVGASLDEVVLNTSLPPGDHPATVVYFMVDDDFEEVASVMVAVQLRVHG